MNNHSDSKIVDNTDENKNLLNLEVKNDQSPDNSNFNIINSSLPLNNEKVFIHDTDHKFLDIDIELTYFGSLPDVLKIFLIGAMFYLQYGMQQFILLTFLNKKYSNANMSTGIGIVYNQITLVFYSLFFSINVVYTLLGSNDFGASKHYLFGLQMNRTKFYAYSITLVVGIIYISLYDYIGNILQLNPTEKKYSFIFICFRLIAIFFDYEFFYNLTYLQIIGKGLIGFCVLLPSIFLFPIFCYIFINIGDYEIIGAGLACLFFNISLAIIFWLLIFILGRNEEHIFFFNKDTFTDFLYIVYYTTPIFFLNLLDNFNDEILGIFAKYQPKQEQTAFVIGFSVYRILAALGNTSQNTSNVILSILMGEGLHERATQMGKYMLITYNSIAVIIVIPVLLLKTQILSLMSDDQKVLDIAYSLYYFSLLVVFLDLNSSTLYGYVVSSGRFYLALFIFIGYSCVNIGVVSLLLFVFNFGVIGIVIGFTIAKGSMLITYIFVYIFVIDWKESAELIKKEIDNEATATPHIHLE